MQISLRNKIYSYLRLKMVFFGISKNFIHTNNNKRVKTKWKKNVNHVCYSSISKPLNFKKWKKVLKILSIKKLCYSRALLAGVRWLICKKIYCWYEWWEQGLMREYAIDRHQLRKKVRKCAI